ncbi:LysM peptidoglycan-binding domain-containing protein [Streptomyces chumphonensis]|uniref:LysM peptidoglycan-binding domain-containing protein n=1 Tax=Streptomyces chumphonensis TaxID=1214925 RepID=A0A927IAP5_9ACTN|nr:LysM peptidoglycan-binding domain-containing protein [Streptomyces chumphonensis]
MRQFHELVFPGIVAAASGDKPGGTTYEVQRDDTLYEIARDYRDVSWQQIAAANGIRAPYTIHPGQELTIPAGKTSPSRPPARTVVDLSRLRAAAKTDPPKAGTPVSYAGTLVVELALVEDGLMERRYADGHFGSKSVHGYSLHQQRMGYRGTQPGGAADGIPGWDSLTDLGDRHGFTVVA